MKLRRMQRFKRKKVANRYYTGYTRLSNLRKFSTGYLIVEDSLFYIKEYCVKESWSLSTSSYEDQACESRKIILEDIHGEDFPIKKKNLGKRIRIVVDDKHAYSESYLCYSGRLETVYDTVFEDELPYNYDFGDDDDNEHDLDSDLDSELDDDLDDEEEFF